MKIRKNSRFEITDFSRYKKVPGQYPDQFIKGSRCVKIDETDEIVTVAVCGNYKDRIEILKEVHAPKQIETKIVKESDFAEFIGSCVDRVSKKNGTSEKEKLAVKIPTCHIYENITKRG